ncbi:Uu.00g104180.m01.CDS01 [Anthostomella pinea]|uniref:Uu.00g104180.m01.CDS01 n=1 Tax=Anthostomella pinea TaxID=933095 RepID=A0AAI8VEE4_9PEZI|nr:Uu.00g104180.m01.CDS01 [Anthostomella pinea]
MRFPSTTGFALALAIGASLVAALPGAARNGTTLVAPSSAADCSKESIANCVASTGSNSTTCFGHLCAGRELKKMRKRQDDLECTEENLLECAVMEWREAEVCFEELCL